MKCRECNKDLRHECYTYLLGADAYFCIQCMPSVQPERLNPKDHIVKVNKMVCDSPNPENK